MEDISNSLQNYRSNIGSLSNYIQSAQGMSINDLVEKANEQREKLGSVAGGLQAVSTLALGVNKIRSMKKSLTGETSEETPEEEEDLDDDEDFQNLMQQRDDLMDAKDMTNELTENVGFLDNDDIIPVEMDTEATTDTLNDISDRMEASGEEAGEEAGEDAAEDVGEDVAEDTAIGITDGILDSIPVVGEIASLSTILYEAFDPSSKPSSALQTPYTSSFIGSNAKPTMDSVLDRGGSGVF